MLDASMKDCSGDGSPWPCAGIVVTVTEKDITPPPLVTSASADGVEGLPATALRGTDKLMVLPKRVAADS